MVEEESRIVLSDLVELVRRRRARRDDGQSMSLAEAVEAIVASHSWRMLQIHEAPVIAIENNIFDLFMKRQEIEGLEFFETLDANCIPALLETARQSNVKVIFIEAIPMSETQANRIFTGLRLCTLNGLTFTFGEHHSHGVLQAFQNYIREANSLISLGLSCEDDNCVSLETFESICSAILDSSSLKVLFLCDIRVRQGGSVDRTHDSGQYDSALILAHR